MAVRMGVLLLFAEDFGAMRRFYGEAVGLAERTDVDPGPPYQVGETWTILEDADGRGLELFDAATHAAVHPDAERRNSLLLTFLVDDVEATAERMLAAGVPLDGEVGSEEWGSYVYVLDPDGNRVQFYRTS